MAWDVVFKTYSVPLDYKREEIIKGIRKRSKIARSNDVEDTLLYAGVDTAMTSEVSPMLFVNMLRFTEGDARSKVISGVESNAFESYRYIHTHGRDVSMRQRMSMPTKATNS